MNYDHEPAEALFKHLKLSRPRVRGCRHRLVPCCPDTLNAPCNKHAEGGGSVVHFPVSGT